MLIFIDCLQSESVLIGKIYTHFKRTPGTHKLGVLYVIDSVTRQWLEHARKAGQQPGPGATDGTYAAGVFHVTELLPSLMVDIINAAPEDQKVRFLDASRRITVWLEHISVDILYTELYLLISTDDPSFPCVS